jgi:FKBP-type peptidyl-prolyl cis-trans isomerase
MKFNFPAKTFFIAIGASLMLASCDNSPYPGYEQLENGVYMKYYNHDEAGVHPKEGDVIQIKISYKNDKDSVLFDSKQNPDGSNMVEVSVPKSEVKGGFEDALKSMAVGDSASFIISADSFFTKSMKVREWPPFVTKGSMLTFDAKLVKVTSKDEVEKEMKKRKEEERVMMELQKNQESKTLMKYLEDNKITAKPTESGLIYVETKKGSGPKAQPGQLVKVNYVGRLVDGTVFDTSDPEVAKKAGVFNPQRPYEAIEFPLGPGSVIQGWVEGLQMMSKGGKATFILPSSMGYGERGSGPIPPFSTLIFDVELVDIKAAPESSGMNIK